MFVTFDQMAPNTVTTKMMLSPKQSDLVSSVTTAKVKNISNGNGTVTSNSNAAINNNTSNKNHNDLRIGGVERKSKILPNNNKTSNGKPQAPIPPSDVRAKKVLKEAVDAVVNSFAKHTQGCYGRGKCSSHQ